MARHRLLAMLTMGATAGAVACHEVPFEEEPLPGYTLLTEEVWSGGDIVLVSPRFQGLRENVRLVIAGDNFPTVHRRADTVVFRADSLMSGTYPIAVLPFVPQTVESLAEVTVRGFQTCYPGPQMSGFALPWKEASPEPTFVADGAESAIIVYAATGRSVPAVPASAHIPGYGMGPGWAYEPYSVILSGGWSTEGSPSTCLWRLRPTPEMGECTGHWSDWHAALVGPGKWVFARHHRTYRTWGDDPTSHQLEEPTGLAVSPGGDLVVLSGASSEGQLVLPVADEPAFRIPALYHAEAPAVFSPDGDTVYMAGWRHDGTSVLVVLEHTRPTDPIAEVELGDLGPVDLDFDIAAPYLYIVNQYGDVMVIDRRTLEQVGWLHTPYACHREFRGYSWVRRLLLSRNHGVLYQVLVWAYREPAGPSTIYRFDLLAPE